MDRLLKDEDGALTIFGIYIFAAMAIVSGIAVDYQNLLVARTQLQVASDTVAHAAIYDRERLSAEEAKTVALRTVEDVLPSARYGTVIRPEDITFGRYDRTEQKFYADPASNSAVLISASRLRQAGNPVPALLTRFIGIPLFDVRANTIYETYVPSCLREGFMAEGIVNTTTGNTYEPGFCIHSQTAVAFNSNNEFKENVIVSMPDKNDVILPSDGLATNPGLEAALRSNSMRLRVLDRIDAVAADPASPHFRDYLTNLTPIDIDPKTKLDAAVWTEGAINRVSCAKKSSTVHVPAGTVLRSGVLVTDCQIKFRENVGLEDVSIVSYDTTSKAISSASGLRMGLDDNCTPGGGAQIVTMGSVDIPQYLKMFGSQIIAAGDVAFTSDAFGMQGTSIVAGGRIDGTTDSVMGFCSGFCGGAGMENGFQADYYRQAL